MRLVIRMISSLRSNSARGLAALLLALTVMGTGCAGTYAITTTNGGTILCKGRPKLSRGYYYYRDGAGQEQRINELRVREIAAQ